MLQALGQANLLGVLVVAALGWGFARVLDAPRWAGPAILLVVVIIAALSQIALPPEAPLRQTTGGAVRALVWLAAAAVPILAYRALLRRLRGAVPAPTPHPQGFVIIPEDAALVEDIAARLGAAVPTTETVSLAHRAPDGALTASLRLQITDTLASLHNIWVDPTDPTLAPRLLTQAEDEARRRAATTVLTQPRTADQATQLRTLGYRAITSGPLPLLAKDLL